MPTCGGLSPLDKSFAESVGDEDHGVGRRSWGEKSVSASYRLTGMGYLRYCLLNSKALVVKVQDISSLAFTGPAPFANLSVDTVEPGHLP